jgi:hypothetical protein
VFERSAASLQRAFGFDPEVVDRDSFRDASIVPIGGTWRPLRRACDRGPGGPGRSECRRRQRPRCRRRTSAWPRTGSLARCAGGRAVPQPSAGLAGTADALRPPRDRPFAAISIVLMRHGIFESARARRDRRLTGRPVHYARPDLARSL